MLSREEHKNNLKNLRYDLSEEVKKLRNRNNMSIEEAAFEAKIPIGILKDIELGNLNKLNVIFSLAKAFDKKIRIEFY